MALQYRRPQERVIRSTLNATLAMRQAWTETIVLRERRRGESSGVRLAPHRRDRLTVNPFQKSYLEVLGNSRFGAFFAGRRRRIVCIDFRRLENLARNPLRRDEIHNFLDTISRGHASAKPGGTGTTAACGSLRLLFS